MYSSRTAQQCSGVQSQRAGAHLLKSISATQLTPITFRSAAIVVYQQPIQARQFHSSPRTQIRDFFPEPENPNIRKTNALWTHPLYTVEQMNAIKVHHRETRDWRDKVALTAMRILRKGLDLASGYRHNDAMLLNATDPVEAARKYGMTEKKYLTRNVFLESVAGVPGMVAGMLRHLHSMRRMKRDNGWIETLLEESYNERMHLLIFLKMCEPGWFMRLAVLGAQGVFFNAMFVSYLISPKISHRFVGYLEEEAVLTYTKELEDIDAGRLPTWGKREAPQIAIDYYKMQPGKQTVRDLIMHIRADEAKHSEVNHTLGNLDQRNDPNPYVSEYKDKTKPHPTKDIRYWKAGGWERSDVM